jgi:hypothetical protein
MTIKECIDIVDNSKPNQYSPREKVMWLSFIDEMIINDVLKTHEGYDGRYDDFTGYSEEKLSVPLIVKSPYDRLYTAYLKMQIDGANGETARYNNSAALFNSYYMEFRKAYHKTHMPVDAMRNKPMITFVHTEEKPTTELIESAIEKALANTNKISSVTLYADKWVGTSDSYSQLVSIAGVTSTSKIDLNPTVEQLGIFHSKDLAFVVGNDNGIVTVYCIGQKPTNDYTMQVTITEVAVDG